MLDNQDIATLQRMFDQHAQDMKADIRDEIRSSIAASEHRMKAHVEDVVGTAKKEIVTELSELLDASVLPQIAELQTDMTRVKQHSALV